MRAVIAIATVAWLRQAPFSTPRRVAHKRRPL